MKGWKRPFEEPIALSTGEKLVILEDAGRYIEKLPKRTHDKQEWQTAIRILLATAEGKDSIIHARLAVMQALNPGERAFDPSRKDPHWGKRKLKRETSDDPLRQMSGHVLDLRGSPEQAMGW